MASSGIKVQHQMDKLFSAEKVMRTRTLSLTTIEVLHLKSKFNAEKEQAMLQKVLKGGKDNVSSIKAALQICITNSEELACGGPPAFEVGTMVPLMSQEFSLLKLLYSAWVHSVNVPSTAPKEYPCYCLPFLALMPKGCSHVKVSMAVPRVPYSRHICHNCMVCYRCGGCLACSQWESKQQMT